MSSHNYSSLFLLLSPPLSSSSLPPFLTLLTFFLPLTPFRVSIFSAPSRHQGKCPKVPSMSHPSYWPFILFPLFLLTVFLHPALVEREFQRIASRFPFSPSLCSPLLSEVRGRATRPLPLSLFSPQSCLQQLEVQVLELGLASRLPSELSGGGDSRAKVGTWAGSGAGAVI